ncbi:hypothetical protein EGM88_05325 [Aureibaculum marinum]|uniref:Tail specific protease domain-containing protein n=1 Tax=Aureibaculum marinum TaxID=2487930 RepID=A0A3N4NQV6_9FLAO|nr:S41 family peptidase [Aureibaculum marinum]RPD98614.1 hypothetical protein EGM88_05325 [Aureibaculum marinum]
MKTKLFLLIAFFHFTNNLTAQSKLSEIDKLASTAKVWGFLKYYHPQVAQGKFNWDNELLKILPKVEQSKNKEELSLIYLNWINSLGEIKKCNSCHNNHSNYFDKNFDLSWIQNSNSFTKEVSLVLENIEKNRYVGKKPYYAQASKIGNISITNEPEYKNKEYLKNVNYRYLSLFKYWNIIEYYFPYKYMTDQKWSDVLIEMIPKFKDATNEETYHLAIQETSAKINDSHTPLMVLNGVVEHLNGGDKTAPVRLTVLNDNVIVTRFYNDSLAKKNDLKIGDTIIKVEDETTQDIIKRMETFVPASNKNRTKFYTQQILLREYKDSLKIAYVRKGEIYEKYVQLYSSKEINFKIPEPLTKKFKILNDNIGYINMGGIRIYEVKEMMKELMNCKAIIFDLRYRPHGTYRYISKYLNSNRTEFAKLLVPDVSYPGRYTWKQTKYTGVGKNNEDYYKGKVILLVHGKTQSHSEYSTMALQTAPNSITIGTQTSGADGNVSRFNFLGGFKTVISGIGVFYPDNTETQRNGIKIDVKVVPTFAGIVAGRDEILEKAIEIINK